MKSKLRKQVLQEMNTVPQKQKIATEGIDILVYHLCSCKQTQRCDAFRWNALIRKLRFQNNGDVPQNGSRKCA